MSQLTVVTQSLPALVTSAGDRAEIRFLEFFASAIRNPHTRRAYARAAGDFLAWCAGAGVSSITAVQPLHVAAWIELQTRTSSAPTLIRTACSTAMLLLCCVSQSPPTTVGTSR